MAESLFLVPSQREGERGNRAAEAGILLRTIALKKTLNADDAKNLDAVMPFALTPGLRKILGEN